MRHTRLKRSPGPDLSLLAVERLSGPCLLRLQRAANKCLGRQKTRRPRGATGRARRSHARPWPRLWSLAHLPAIGGPSARRAFEMAVPLSRVAPNRPASAMRLEYRSLDSDKLHTQDCASKPLLMHRAIHHAARNAQSTLPGAPIMPL
jgi:hypothetical protein